MYSDFTQFAQKESMTTHVLSKEVGRQSSELGMIFIQVTLHHITVHHTWGQREGERKLVGVWTMEERDIAKMNPDHPRDGKNQIKDHKELNCDKLRNM